MMISQLTAFKIIPKLWRGLAGHESALLTVAEHKHGCEGQLPKQENVKGEESNREN
jgi:hypothetical protein